MKDLVTESELRRAQADAVRYPTVEELLGEAMSAINPAAHLRRVALAAREIELAALIGWLRGVNASDGEPDPALEAILQLIEKERPHRAKAGG